MTIVVLYVSNNADYTTQLKNIVILVNYKSIELSGNTNVTVL